MRVAVNSRRKDQSGQWVDKPNFFDVVVFGAQGENCANYLSRGRPVAVEGRLDWREWEAKEGGGKRQAVQIIANSVQFLGSRDGGGAPNGNAGGGGGQGQGQGNQGYGNQGNQGNQSYGAPAGDVPADESDFGPVSTGGGGQEDDIPF
jgi:single-strand DNA-binding protein